MINISYDVITKVKKHILFTDIDLKTILTSVEENIDLENQYKNELIKKIKELISYQEQNEN